MTVDAWPVWAIVAGIMVLVGLVYLTGRRRGRALLDERALRHALSTKVAHVMNRPVVFVREDTLVKEAARIMHERNVGCLPVVDPRGRLAGIATESDLTGIRASRVLSGRVSGIVGDRVRMEGAEAAYDEIRSLPVGEVMTRQVTTAAADEPISDVVIRMMDQDLRHVPVVDDGVPVGIVARHDLLALLARQIR